MASNAVSTNGCTIKIGNGASTETFAAIPELRNFNGPTMDSEDIDVSHLASGSYRDYIQGFKASGEISGECNWTQAGYATLLALFNAGTVRNMQAVMSDGTTYEFQGYVKSIPVTVNTGEQVKFNLTIKITGTVTEASV